MKKFFTFLLVALCLFAQANTCAAEQNFTVSSTEDFFSLEVPEGWTAWTSTDSVKVISGDEKSSITFTYEKNNGRAIGEIVSTAVRQAGLPAEKLVEKVDDEHYRVTGEVNGAHIEMDIFINSYRDSHTIRIMRGPDIETMRQIAESQAYG
ncbi:MAG: hypothetical protein IK027_01815 [Deltaproteobacteria bacterium]|nr:hypothetical protein [Deltaproteobacteria bacterium]